MSEIFNVELIEKEIVDVSLNVIDIIPKVTSLESLDNIDINGLINKQFLVYNSSTGTWQNKNLTELLDYFTKIETPTKIDTTKFQVSDTFLASSLIVWFNGIKENHIINIDENAKTFEFKIPILDDDIIECKYLKKS